MPETDDVWDAGLQPERTALAWQRTALTILGLGFALPRFTWTTLGPWSVALGALPVLGAISLLFLNHRRYRQTHHTLKSGRPPHHDGRLPLLATLMALLLGTIALIALASAAIGPATD